jgi:hypothetical protein
MLLAVPEEAGSEEDMTNASDADLMLVEMDGFVTPAES